MRAFYFTDLPGLPVTTQMEMADRGNAPSWTDTAKSFPEERDKMLKALRPGSDEVWVASLPVIAANRTDLRHVVSVLEGLGASIVEGATGWRLAPPYEQGLSFANCYEWWGKRRKLLDDPRGTGRATRNGSKPRRMPDVEARPIWFDATIRDNEMAVEKMNADPRYRVPWTVKTALRIFKGSGRPSGARPKPARPEQP